MYYNPHKSIMTDLNNFIANQLTHLGISPDDTSWSVRLTIIICILLVTYITTKIFRHLIMPIIQKITAQTKATWDDYLFNHKMLKSFSRMIPPILLFFLLPLAFSDMPFLLSFLQKACSIYIVITTLMLINSFLNSLYDISIEHEALRNRPLKGIYQMINLVAIGIGFILIISILIDKNAATILAGLGASAAVLMLIFKDSILGLVAGVQLSANDMLRPGDWITMTKYGADGYVIEVTLTTVKVQNFDKTITTIPPYVLVSDSFQNWRGMRESGGRRIKRWINIDMTTIRFCQEEEKAKFMTKGWLTKEEAEKHTSLVNLHIFRNYLQQYLTDHPRTNKDMMIMVRQLQPTSEGLPLEVYCFTDTTEWIEYEQIQAEIFNHILAVLPQFGLRIFQRPTGNDLTNATITN